MKKIGIVTFHFPTNYGAKLQCVALFKYLQKMDSEVKIIDYRPRYHSWKYAYFRNPFYIAQCTSNGSKANYWKIVLRFILSYGKVNRLIKNIKNEIFNRKYLQLTKKCINYDSLKQMKNAFDIIIVGSDQIWNYHLTNGEYDYAYFADFASITTRRIAYAPSAGNVPDLSHMEELTDLVSKFDMLSVREQSLKDAFGDYGIEATKVVDPTMLLSKADWVKIEKKPFKKINRDFICVYSLFLDEKMINAVTQCAQHYKCVIIDLSPTPKRIKGWKYALTCDPSEFLWYIHHSKLVIADSFHALVFSIIYQKQFISFTAGKTTSRLKDLLNDLGLASRIFSEEIPIENYYKIIDYNSVNEIIDFNRNLSVSFLEECLEKTTKLN